MKQIGGLWRFVCGDVFDHHQLVAQSGTCSPPPLPVTWWPFFLLDQVSLLPPVLDKPSRTVLSLATVLFWAQRIGFGRPGCLAGCWPMETPTQQLSQCQWESTLLGEEKLQRRPNCSWLEPPTGKRVLHLQSECRLPVQLQSRRVTSFQTTTSISLSLTPLLPDPLAVKAGRTRELTPSWEKREELGLD